MKRPLATALFLMLAIPHHAQDNEPLNSEKEQLIDELLHITGAAKLGELFGNAFLERMTESLRQSRPNIDPKAFTILREEIAQVIHEEVVVGKTLNKLSYPIYHRYLSSSDIAELIRFYKTPVGHKIIDVMPTITQEAMQAGRVWGESLGPEIQQRINHRFEIEGIKL